MVFQFPKQTVIFGPRQIAARINQDQVIAPQITLWNQQGSEVIQGTLLVIPIEESLVYIRPLYLRAAGGQIPELKRVIVAYQNQIVMEETLRRGPRAISSPAAGGLQPPGTAPKAPPPPEPARACRSRMSLRSPPRPARTTSARCRRSAKETGPVRREIKQLGAVLQKLAQQK